jgi:hypothetical protein
MKCAICRRETSWDESFGYVDFIVCPKCFGEIHKKYDIVKTMDIIFMLGDIAKKHKKTK